MLEGHHRSINALQFVTIDSEESLVSAGSDYVIIWHLHEVNNSYKNGEFVGVMLVQCCLRVLLICNHGHCVKFPIVQSVEE